MCDETNQSCSHLLKSNQMIHSIFSELKNETLFMLMEKGEMDLEKYLRLNNKLEDGRIRTLWVQMLSAVASIHKQGIIHTDLKPPNFLFVDSALKLIDFGIAKGLQVRVYQCFVGSNDQQKVPGKK